MKREGLPMSPLQGAGGPSCPDRSDLARSEAVGEKIFKFLPSSNHEKHLLKPPFSPFW